MNSDQIKELIEKIPFGLVLFLYVGYLGFQAYDFQYSDSSELGAQRAKIESARVAKQKSDKRLQDLKVFIRALEAKKVEIRKLAQELQETKEGLSETVDVPKFMKTVITEAKKVGVIVESLKPKTKVDRENFSEWPFDLSLRGSYAQIAAFMDRLANVTDIIRVESLEFKSQGNGTERYILLSAKVDIRTYSYRESSADKLGKGDSSAGKPVPAPSSPSLGAPSRGTS